MKPSKFDRVKDPIASIRWIFDMEACFFTCSCLDEQKVKFVLNLLRLMAKN